MTSILDRTVFQELPPVEERLPHLSISELTTILGLTIKKDDVNKLVTFLALLTAYTYDSQLNLSFNAPSSTGKSFIPTEIAKLFPEEDVMEVGYTSPTAFFHDAGEFDREKGGYIVDLSGKILIFLDQPHDILLQHLRPMLSHDKKEIVLKVTDKSQKHGLKTKNIFLIGFPVVIFCTAGLRVDEQESTRFLLLSPEINNEKIRAAVKSKIKKEADNGKYEENLLIDPGRSMLRQRIKAIKEAGVKNVNLSEPELVELMFFNSVGILKPRHSRDVGKVISLIKAFALMNLWDRELREGVLYTAEEDMIEAFKIWGVIAESQEMNLPPYVYNLFKDIIQTAYANKNQGVSSDFKRGLMRQDIIKKHHETYGRFLPDWQLRQQIIPLLETAGLIYQEPDTNDKRKILIYPTTQLTVSHLENNSELGGGVGQALGRVA